jgi:hypothetical protein
VTTRWFDDLMSPGHQVALVNMCAVLPAPLVFVRPGEVRKAEWVTARAKWQGTALATGKRLPVWLLPVELSSLQAGTLLAFDSSVDCENPADWKCIAAYAITAAWTGMAVFGPRP